MNARFQPLKARKRVAYEVIHAVFDVVRDKEGFVRRLYCLQIPAVRPDRDMDLCALGFEMIDR